MGTRYTRSRLYPGGDQIPVPGEDQVRTRFTRSKGGPCGALCYKVWGRPRWQPHSRGPGEANLQVMQRNYVPVMLR